jgi:hypothetical protein
MTKGGLIMDVVNAEQAKRAEEAGVRTLIFGSFWRCIGLVLVVAVMAVE